MRTKLYKCSPFIPPLGCRRLAWGRPSPAYSSETRDGDGGINTSPQTEPASPIATHQTVASGVPGCDLQHLVCPYLQVCKQPALTSLNELATIKQENSPNDADMGVSCMVASCWSICEVRIGEGSRCPAVFAHHRSPPTSCLAGGHAGQRQQAREGVRRGEGGGGGAGSRQAEGPASYWPGRMQIIRANKR